MEKLNFQLKNQKTGNIIYNYDVELLEFQKETIENENVSFFYTFKDIKIELEESIPLKLKLKGSGEGVFLVLKYSDKVLNESIIDSPGISEEDVNKNEVQLYFIFEKLSKILINKIAEEHKNIVFSNVENN
jgi:hypothetical protein